MMNAKYLIEPYLCDNYEETYAKNNAKYELINIIADKLSKIKSYIQKFLKEIMETNLLIDPLSSFDQKDNFLKLFLIIQQIIDTSFNENYIMINKILEYLIKLKKLFNKYFKKYDEYINIQKNFTNKLVDITIAKNNFIQSTKSAELATFDFLIKKAYSKKLDNPNEFHEKEKLKHQAKLYLDKYKSLINEGNNELKIFINDQKHFYRIEKELAINYLENYSTCIMTSLEHQLKINQITNEIRDNIVKLNNLNNNKLIDDLKKYKPKEEIDFQQYITNLEFDNCNDSFELSICVMAMK